VWLGYQWLHAGWEKVIGYSGGTFSWKFGMTDDSWLRTSAGLKGFAGFALQGAGGEHASVNYGWYASFLRWIEHSGGWLAPVIAIGEVAIGIGLILGILTGVSAFFGAAGSGGHSEPASMPDPGDRIGRPGPAGGFTCSRWRSQHVGAEAVVACPRVEVRAGDQGGRRNRTGTGWRK
jgi:uncharacterized membrane protein YphA (DoxX/SURF4 family)